MTERLQTIIGGLWRATGGLCVCLSSIALCVVTAHADDIRSSQNTILKPLSGQFEKVRSGARAFLDTDDHLADIPEELLGRTFIRVGQRGGEATCTQAGYAYAIAEQNSEQAKVLAGKGFRPLDWAPFRLFKDDPSVAIAYQKHLSTSETLAFGPRVIVVFGPEERGGVPYARMRSLTPPAFLPDGSEFKTWEVPFNFAKTYYVEQLNQKASDQNPGTKELPFKTINHAAQLLQPGERVVVGTGVYRECVRPARGGTDPEHIISYEAAPGAKPVIKGSEALKVTWSKSAPWIQDNRSLDPIVKQIWMARLPPELFAGYNPFGIANNRQVDQSFTSLADVFVDARARIYLQVSGLLFQGGKMLRQVTRYSDLFMNEGAFWAETNGNIIHVSPYDGADPNRVEWEATAREQIFAPEQYHLGYIRLKGFILQHAGNSFPFPQRGAVSTMVGHHWIIEGNTIDWVNSVGIDIGDQGLPHLERPEIVGYHVVRGNTLNDIGVTGVTGPGPIDSLIEDNVFRRNAWQDVEPLAECAAIKTHHNFNVLIRRNLIFDTLHGAGIWIDYINSNSRISQNLVVGTGTDNGPGPGTGGIFVEAATEPNFVDHNVVWGSTETNGIYLYTATKVTIAYNMIGNCATAAIRLIDIPGREKFPSGGNTVVGNLIVNNGWNIDFFSPRNSSDYNLIGNARLPRSFRLTKAASELGVTGWRKNYRTAEDFDLPSWRESYKFDLHSSAADVTATFDTATLKMVLSVRGSVPEVPPIEGITADFWARPASSSQLVPGPFGRLPTETTSMTLDPRRGGE